MDKHKNRNRNMTLSVRVSAQDAAFLKELKLEGAITASEKLRAILASARHREQGLGSYEDALRLQKEILAPALKELRAYELKSETHSEFLKLLTEWLPEITAFVSTALLTHDEERSNDSWKSVERGCVQRSFTFIRAVLRMALTKESACFDPTLISAQLPLVMETLKSLERAHASASPAAAEKIFSKKVFD